MSTAGTMTGKNPGDTEEVETEEERKERLKKPVRLPRITTPAKCMENVYSEIWGTSFLRRPPPFPETKGRKRHGKRDDKERHRVLPEQDQEPLPEHVAPDDKPKKLEWMGGSLVSVAFTVAALIALVMVIKMTS
jgi:hypothetical protein